ncbi:MAG: MotA/TolQ/ExbB proton channel family protein [Treponema sp.]|jgi:biopolymer transport protein ExbB|nr:MotA/TolQ/ExbB proton channel family protein [Treponema sp.]
MKGLEKAVDFINAGGPINWVILALYLLTLGILSERLAYFFRTRREKRSPLGRMSDLFIGNRDKSEAALSEILDREGAVIKKEMEKGLGILSFIETTAPLLGLLGTITGLMETFHQIEMRGSGADISYLSGGIREAMITTFSGLVTAICAAGCSKLFEHISSSRLHDMSLGLSVLAEKTGQDIPARNAESA